MARIQIKTFGCSANHNDSELMAGLLVDAGHKIVENNPDLVILNTCIVKEATRNRMRHLVLRAKNKLVVAGCMPEVEPVEGVSNIGPHNLSDVVDVVEKTLKGEVVNAFDRDFMDKTQLPRVRLNDNIQIVQILEGCVGECAYCIVKHAKSTLYSFPIEKIVGEVRKGVDGVNEIWLTSQDNAAYMLDKTKKTKLPLLLRQVNSIDGKFLVRVGMMNPNNILPVIDELVDSWGEKIFRFVHIPVQSGSDRILNKMNRRYCVDDFRFIIEKFRERFPRLSVSTDIIVGFPTETDEEFNDSVELVKEIKPDFLNISKYSEHKETSASRMTRVDVKKVMERSRKLTEIAKKISLEKNKRWVGWEGEVFFDEKGTGDSVIGRNIFYMPIVLKNGRTGEFVNVKIKQAHTNYLLARTV